MYLGSFSSREALSSTPPSEALNLVYEFMGVKK
jgi:hypothetical protein